MRKRTLRDRLEGLALLTAGTSRAATQRLGRRRESALGGLAPDLAAVIGLTERFGWPAPERLPLADARREFEREERVLAIRRPNVGAFGDLAVAGADGPLEARFYAPRGAPDRGPLLLYLHGGGWVLGSAASSDATCRFLARYAAVRVLTVSYRLAPEAPFPAALDDAGAALRWVHREAAGLGVHPGRVIIGGDSAGANLATVAAREAVGRVAGQLLLYPITDLSREQPSYVNADGPVLTAEQMRWFRRQYLAGADDGLDPRVSPLRSADLGGLPPAYVAIAGHDPLRDEGLLYATRLREAGVPVTLAVHARQAHGFADFAPVVPSARAALREACHWLASL